MNTIKFYLFGKFCFKVGDNLIDKIEPHKAEELLGFLLLNKSSPHSRDKLADLLWGEISPGQSNSYLRKALWQLQYALNQYGIDKTSLLLVNAEWLQINPTFEFWLDTGVFEDSFQQTRGKLGRELSKEQAQIIKQAVEIYRGELLDGWYQNWCLYERERFEHRLLTMLDKLTDYCEAHEQYEEGLLYGEKILQCDHAREHTHRQVMRIYYLSGNRTAALRQYQKCVKMLREELDVEPTVETRKCFEMIHDDKLENIQHYSKDAENGGFKARKNPSDHLNALQEDLTKIQILIAKDIQVIQQTLKDNQ
jgi:DNA-binding SARP family transcriptional activator